MVASVVEDPYGYAYNNAANAANQMASQNAAVHQWSVDPIPPEDRIVKLVREDLGVTLNPQAVRMFIRARWARLSKAAHEVHDA